MKSAASSASPLRTIYAEKRVGECFEFGRYPQGANGEIEPITWRILQREKEHLLVIAEKCLDCKPYNAEFRLIAWADCTLHRWLNSEFYDKAFNGQEQECILKTSIVNKTGPNTEGYIFLLSIDEARSLFANDIERCAKPTKCTVKNRVFLYDGYCYWWLRSRGDSDNLAACVNTGGVIYDSGINVSFNHSAVRPVFKIAL